MSDNQISRGPGRPSNADRAEVKTLDRGEVRPAMRAEDPRAAADARAAAIFEHLSGNFETGEDKFAAPPAPEGWTYEWKRFTVFNEEDPGYQVKLAQTGWEPVPLNRHKNMMPEAYSGSGTIKRDGMMLMQRPAEVTDFIRNRENSAARDQVRTKEEQLSGTPQGTLPRDADPRTKPKIRKSIEPMAIPDK